MSKKPKKIIKMGEQKPKKFVVNCVLCKTPIEVDENSELKDGLYESYIIKQSGTTTMAAGYLCSNCLKKDISERIIEKKDEVLIKI